MSKNPQVTREYSESRHFSGPILQKARVKLASQHQLTTITRYTPYSKKPYQETTFNAAHFNSLIERMYNHLRDIYSIPIYFNLFKEFIYRHPAVYTFSKHSYWAELHNSGIGSRRNRNYWRNRRSYQGIGRYYRYGESFIQHGIKPKEELTSDQYQVNHKQARRDWRDRKKFAKDQGKGRCFCKCNLTDARFRRRWERDLIKKGDYDKIYYNKDLFTDSWQCC